MNKDTKADVICAFPSKAYSVEFWNNTATSENLVASVPCETKEQAWAMADAFNYPEHNSNDWREAMLTPKPMFGLFANGELDQICYTEEDARSEAKDLIDMGCDDIRIYKLVGENSEFILDVMNERFRDGKPFGRKAMAKAKLESQVDITFLYHHR